MGRFRRVEPLFLLLFSSLFFFFCQGEPEESIITIKPRENERVSK